MQAGIKTSWWTFGRFLGRLHGSTLRRMSKPSRAVATLMPSAGLLVGLRGTKGNTDGPVELSKGKVGRLVLPFVPSVNYSVTKGFHCVFVSHFIYFHPVPSTHYPLWFERAT